MSSCVMTSPLPVSTLVHSPALRALKRPRSSDDAMSVERILKAHKRSRCDSPRALNESTPDSLAEAAWPVISASDSSKHAIAFLRDSRHHALLLLAQNQWQRAMSVLDKVERANEIVTRQRRKVVLEQANTTFGGIERCEPKLARKVRFSEDVSVAAAIDAERSAPSIPTFVREEILILRASRPIPAENYSEFWS